MKITSDLLRETAKYVEQYMAEHFTEIIVFHNYSHTVKVVRVCDMLSMESNLSKKERRLIHLAAWFSNIGYKENPNNHEEESAKHAGAFFENKGLDRADIQLIQECILATKAPQHPHTAASRILCDAVLYYLADKNYFDELALLRREWELTKGLTYTDEEWFKLNIDFLSNHFYFTPFARKQFDKDQQNNLARLKGHLAIFKHAGNNKTQVNEIDEGKNLLDSDTKLSRGVETLFRVASDKQMQLNQLGDGKANILISINSIILSVVISFAITRIDISRQLILPILILVIVCLTTIVLAVLSTRPKISHGTFTPQQIISKEANLLFFGNFHNMPLAEYKSAMKEMMIDKEYLYESLIMDIYYVGKVLARKYRFTTWAYNVFMFGLIISMIAFCIHFYLYDRT
jgi:predicted metal-dependent HD superfamily phosphohydrolase